MNNIVNNPFGLSNNAIWIIQNILPIMVILLGWIAIYHLNKRNIKDDKLIVARVDSYKELQKNISNALIDYDKLRYIVNDRSRAVLSLTRDGNYQRNVITENYLKADIEKDKLFVLYNKAFNSLSEFIQVWEVNNLLFIEMESYFETLKNEIKITEKFEREYINRYYNLLHRVGKENDSDLDVMSHYESLSDYVEFCDKRIGLLNDVAEVFQKLTYGSIIKKDRMFMFKVKREKNELNNLVKWMKENQN